MISAVFKTSFPAESFSASLSASDKDVLCNLTGNFFIFRTLFYRYFTEKIEICTLFLIQSMRGLCKISLEAEIRRDWSVWRKLLKT